MDLYRSFSAVVAAFPDPDPLPASLEAAFFRFLLKDGGGLALEAAEDCWTALVIQKYNILTDFFPWLTSLTRL